jgi:fused signal recognition particle receptor
MPVIGDTRQIFPGRYNLKYRFSAYDYIIYLLSFMFFYLYIADTLGTLPFVLPIDIPAWSYLVAAVVFNAWVIPIPGIHPRTPGPIEEYVPEKMAEALPEGEALPEPEIRAVPSPKEKLEKGLSKTHKGFIDRISAVFRRSGELNENILTELEETLVGTDIGVRTAYTIFEYIQKNVGSIKDADQAMESIKTEITSILVQREEPVNFPTETKPYVIMVTGVNGSGKTTTIAKIAYHLKNEGHSVIIASGDTFRAAAIEQLEHWADKVGADFIKSHEGADPSSVAYDGLEAAMARGHDVLIIDTAGRLHTKENLMEELKKTQRVLDKKLPGSPHEILLVLDATIGQNAIEQTRQFNNALGVTGIALTKLDGSSKGGVIVGIANEFAIPIRYIGVGEGMDDLQPFRAQDFVHALFLDNA